MQMPPPSMQMPPPSMMNGAPHGVKPQPPPPSYGPSPPSSSSALFSHISSMFDSAQGGSSQVWGTCPLPPRPPPAYLGQMEAPLPPPPDGSKAPGYRCPPQRMVNSPIGLHPLDPSGSSMSMSSSGPSLTSFSSCMSGNPAYLQGHAPAGHAPGGHAPAGHAPVGTPAFSRQHFSPHPWSAASSCESPVLSVSSCGSSPLCASAVTATMVQSKPSGGGPQQDKKVPQPIGTERLARIRQTGSGGHAMMPSGYSSSVGHAGVWTFGLGAVHPHSYPPPPPEPSSAWAHAMHPHHHQGEPSAFSQHQVLERDDSGMVSPANSFLPGPQQHQAVAQGFMDFPKGLPMSLYGGAMLPPHPALGEGPGGSMYGHLHPADHSWNPLLKVVNPTDNTDTQQVWSGSWGPHVGNVHLNHVN